MKNPFTLEGKHILITGASSGIGRQCAISCSEMGAKVTLVARNTERLEETLSMMTGEGHLIISQDVSEIEKIKDVVDMAVATLGKIDGFVHCAGIEKTLPISQTSKSDYLEIFNINTIAAFEFLKFSTKKKNRASFLSVVFISSVMGDVGNSALLAYSSSKGALVSGVKSAAIELARNSIRVNCVSPGHLKDTAMSKSKEEFLSQEDMETIESAHPLGLGSVSDVANSVLFLLSDASKWITGTNLIVDGGYCAK